MSSSIKDKIRKLLALARDKAASEHEAAQALEHATRLMMRHGIEERDVETSILFGDILEVDKRWHMFAAQAAGALCGTIPVFHRNSKSLTGVAFTGRQDNVDGSLLVYEFIAEQIERLYKVTLPKGLSQRERGEFRRHFKDACALRVLGRANKIINELSQERDSTSRALVVLDHRKQLAEEANNFLNGKVKTKNTNVSLKFSRGTILGSEAGDQVKLQRSVQQ